MDQSLLSVRRFHKEGEQLLLRGYSPFALGPPPLHHICVAVHGGLWRLTAVGDFQKPLRFGLWRPMAVKRRFADRSENHGAPGSNPGPATY